MKKNYKKYSNRKIYDTEKSKYVTLKDIVKEIKKGANVNVLEHETGFNVTRAVLGECVLRYTDVTDSEFHKLIVNSNT